ncbi:MAG: PcfJ domain-containing protein [Alphaproteobacteria bacterium]|nr:PcfJ domain-containing protein [Alphaproteobacteria bacterium]
MKSRARIEKMEDGKGVYGYAITGVEKHYQERVVLRPDRIVPDLDVMPSWLQQVPPFARKIGRFSENTMVECLARSFLRTNNLIHPYDEEWTFQPEEEHAKQRRYYFAAIARSRRILNSVIRGVMEETTDPGVVRIARRFSLEHRYSIYRHISRSSRAAQLAVTYPLLALLLYGYRTPHNKEMRDEARSMVEAGKRLRDVARVMDAPVHLRRIEPGATDYLRKLYWPKYMMDRLPKGTRSQRVWLIFMETAERHDAPGDVLKWLARTGAEFGTDWRVARADLSNILDWMRACWEEDGQLIRRPFSPDMSLATVRELSAEWHYAVAMADHRSNAIFPDPWFPEKTIKGLIFRPITTPQELFLEGREMHNCLASYVDRVVEVETFIYSVRRDNKRVASLALQPFNGRATIQQIAGPCNATVPRDVERAARRFVKQPFTMPARKPQPGADFDFEETLERPALANAQGGYGGAVAEEIPF